MKLIQSKSNVLLDHYFSQPWIDEYHQTLKHVQCFFQCLNYLFGTKQVENCLKRLFNTPVSSLVMKSLYADYYLSLVPVRTIDAHSPVMFKIYAIVGYTWSSCAKIKMFRREVKRLRVLRHDNIVKLHSCVQVYAKNNGTLFACRNTINPVLSKKANLLLLGICFQRWNLTLSQLCQQTQPELITELDRKLIFKQIGSALSYIHRKHRLCLSNSQNLADHIGVVMGNSGNQYKLFDLEQTEKVSMRQYCQYMAHWDFKRTVGNIKCNNPLFEDNFQLTYLVFCLSIQHSETDTYQCTLNLFQQAKFEDENFKQILFDQLQQRQFKLKSSLEKIQL